MSTLGILFSLLLVASFATYTPGGDETASESSKEQTTQLAALQSATDEPAKSRRSELVCTSEKVLGSIMPRRTCRTRRQAEAAETAAEDYMRRTEALPSQGTSTFER